MTDLLKAAGREYTLFVEPQDFEAYKAHHENVIELEENNRVIGFARLSIQNFAPCGLGWILDDDIRELFQVLPNRKMFSQNIVTITLMVGAISFVDIRHDRRFHRTMKEAPQNDDPGRYLPTKVLKSYFMQSQAERDVINIALGKYTVR